MRARMWAAALTVPALLACSSTAAPEAPAGKQLRIGVDLPLTGPEARAARPALNGVRFFVDTHPTIGQFHIVLDAQDDAAGGPADPERGASNVDRFVADPAVVGMIGPFDGAVARREIPVANSAGLVMIAPAASNPCLTRDVYLPARLDPTGTAVTCKAAGLPSATELRPGQTNNFFRLAATDDLQGAAAADFALGTLHVLRAAVISDHESYGQALAAAFTARFQRAGGSVVGRLDVASGGSADVGAFLGRVRADGAQAVYFGGGAQGCAIRAEMASVFPAGEAAPFLGGDGIAQDAACVAAAGANSAGVYATVPVPDASTLPDAKEALRAFHSAFGSTSAYGLYTMVAYDATHALYAAIERAVAAAGGGAPSRAAVLAQLAGTAGLAGVTGQIGFDQAGDTMNPVLTIFEAPAAGARAAWKPAGTVAYGDRLPY